MGHCIVGFALWCVLGLVGCEIEGVPLQQGARAGALAVNEQALNLLRASNHQYSDGQVGTMELCVAGPSCPFNE